MPKRKRDDGAAAEDAAESKRPKRDKSKYSKNVDPTLTKQERKAARKVAKAQRKALKSQAARIASRAKAEAKAQAKAARLAARKEKAAGKPAAQVQAGAADGVNAGGQAQLAGNAKARRKAARKAERLAKQHARRTGQGNGKAATKKAQGVVNTAAAEADATEAVRATAEDPSNDTTSADSDSDSSSDEDTGADEAPALELEGARSATTLRGTAAENTSDATVDDSSDESSDDSESEATIADTSKVETFKQGEPRPAPTLENSSKKEKHKGSSSDLDKSASQAANTSEDKSVATNGGRPQLATNGSHSTSSGYSQHSGLTALTEDEVTQFLQDKQISVKDAGQELRPITSFDFLPSLGAASPFKGFTSPTPIQAATWPYLLSGRDVIGVAETGSGKTLAFGVPCVHRLMATSDSTKKTKKQIRACIVSPTRELALQIQEQLAKFSQSYGLKVTCVYGGVNKDSQRAELKGTHIVVATPGRLNDFIQEGSIDLSQVDYLVLDEADRMLDKGFEDEVRKIASNTASKGRQTLMFTATWPQSVRDLAATFMTNPVRVIIGESSGELRANTRIAQEVEVVSPRDKQQRLFQLLKQYQSGKNKNDKILVFCLYKKEATRIEEFIRYKGFNVAGIHGDLSQQKRTESLEAFKKGTVPLLVATDVAARGLDIPAVKLVINVTFPLTVEDYVHRIGRTGRAGQDGRAITLFTEEEKGLAGALINVLKAANQPVPDELLKFGTTVKKKAHDAYGAFYKDPADMKKATKITFD